MGKHFVTVCVFCLLCATHTPCSSHVQFSTTEKRSDDGQISAVTDPDRLPVKKSVFDKITDRYSPTDNFPINFNPTSTDNLNSLSFNHKKSKSRRKRDEQKKNFDETLFIEKIFNDFGNGQTINQQGFERLIKTLQLDQLLWSKINNSASNSPPSTKVAVNGGHNDTNTTCMDHRDLIKSVSQTPVNTNFTNSMEEDFNIDGAGLRKLCPVLLYQLVAPSSAERQGCIKVAPGAAASLQHDVEAHATIKEKNNTNMGSVWLYSTLSIIIISACGLLGVLVIPIMQQHFYQHLIQFLVALAVGTLAGDALLHLLPHAMMAHSHEHDIHVPDTSPAHEDGLHQHELNMWKGFVAMIGVIFFFFMEKCLTLGAEWRKQRQLRKNKLPSRVRVMREQDTASTASVGCKHKYSSYPYCYGVIATETQDDHHNHPQNHQHSHNIVSDHNNTTSTILHELGDSDTEAVGGNHHQHHQEANQNQCPCHSHANSALKCSESSKMLAELPAIVPGDKFEIHKALNNQLSESESYTVILRTHENKHHGHSHTHGHVHSAPKSLSSVAWMVIMGDGLHNFTDGMAIGAAFAGSLAGGFSTAVAVFCHELPHEIGDFAVLLKAGMTARQAIFYNMLSSVLCLFGMVLGVVLGNSDQASGWIFACAAGMFLYIALVDMIPELTTSHSKEGGSFLQCILQFFGLLSGLGIMLVIAMYEHDLKRLFDD